MLKKCLTRSIFGESVAPIQAPRGLAKRAAAAVLTKGLGTIGLVPMKKAPFDVVRRREGRDRPLDAETMIGMHRLDNLEHCIKRVVEDRVPGDLIETGVWRGGAAIFMRAVLEVCGDGERCVWLADSFAGLPRPDPRYPADAGDRHWVNPNLAIPVDEVKENFRRYGLLDERVRFLIGWFKDTLPSVPAERFAVVRLDGDMYQSTIEGLESLYPKLSPGGFLIVDDYGAIPACRQAVTDYRGEHGITEPIEKIDWGGVFWRKSAPAAVTG
ncbi:MAG: TylF/MycF/NovP-related O-methyltransferase [Actinomycetota bacterium]